MSNELKLICNKTGVDCSFKFAIDYREALNSGHYKYPEGVVTVPKSLVDYDTMGELALRKLCNDRGMKGAQVMNREALLVALKNNDRAKIEAELDAKAEDLDASTEAHENALADAGETAKERRNRKARESRAKAKAKAKAKAEVS